MCLVFTSCFRAGCFCLSLCPCGNAGKTFDVITRILKSLIGKSVIVPGDFKSVKNQYGIACSYRAQSGHLYPLNRSFLFIVKPVIFVR